MEQYCRNDKVCKLSVLINQEKQEKKKKFMWLKLNMDRKNNKPVKSIEKNKGKRNR